VIDIRALKPDDWSLIPDEARPRQCADTRGLVAFSDKGKLLAAAVLDSWTGNSCMLHIFIGNPFVLKHGFQEELFDYVFNTCGCGIILGTTPADNAKALKLNKHIGFTEIFRIPDGYAVGVDFVVTMLRKEDCKWIKQFKGVVNG